VNNLPLLIPGTPDRDRQYWATVTDDSPLRIRLDGEDDPLPFTPDSLVYSLAVGERVWVAFPINTDPAFKGRRAVILGRANGILYPYAKLQRVATMNLDNDTNEQIEWDTAVYDSHNGWADASTNPTRYTAPVTCMYDFFGIASWSANATNRRAVHLLVDGTGLNGSQIIATAQAVGATSLFHCTSIFLNAGQYVEVNQWQNSGIGLTTATALPTPTLNVVGRAA
jgi:hypothetical protein